MISKQLYFDDLCKALRQTHILKINRFAEQRGDFFVLEAGNATADARYIEEQFRMLLRESDERRNVRLDGLHAALHSRDGSFFRNILANRNDEKRRDVIIRFLADVYNNLKDNGTTVDTGLPLFFEYKIAGYSSHIPTSEFDGMLTRIINEQEWLDKSNQSHFAWDDNIKKGYVLHWDRSNQGYESM